MKKRSSTVLLLGLFVFCLFSGSAFAAERKKVRTSEPFEGTVLAEGLDVPWDIHWGPDGMLWVTERLGKRIVRIHPETGEKKVAATIEEATGKGAHQGVLGMAFGPDLMKNPKNGHVYVVYTYTTDKGQVEAERKKIVRFRYDAAGERLLDPVFVLDGIPAGDDHNGGRLVFGPDEKLYLSLGDLGYNQWGNACKPIEAQRLPTAEEVASKNRAAYVGKVLRLNADGSVPEDNPVLDGVKSHVFTYGHRNPQGLAFVGDYLYSCEHGPSTDDEVNLLVAGGNYGWPHVAGFRDDQAYIYANWSAAPNCSELSYNPVVAAEGVPTQKETDWNAPDFREPLKTFYTVPNDYDFNDARFSEIPHLYWPTIAPASLFYYPENGAIPSWRNSIILTTLKTGALYRLRLSDDKKHIQGDAVVFFHTPNRYRSACLSPDTSAIYVITDSQGAVLDYDGNPTQTLQNPGAVIVFKYAPPKND